MVRSHRLRWLSRTTAAARIVEPRSGPGPRDHGAPFLNGKRGRPVLLRSSNQNDPLLLWRLWVRGQRACVVQAQRHIGSRAGELVDDGHDAIPPPASGCPPPAWQISVTGVWTGLRPGSDTRQTSGAAFQGAKATDQPPRAFPTGVCGDTMRIAEFRGPRSTPDFPDRSRPAPRSRREIAADNFFPIAGLRAMLNRGRARQRIAGPLVAAETRQTLETTRFRFDWPTTP